MCQFQSADRDQVKIKSTDMPYLIDGHNLIPKIRGLSLKDIDDENQLIELLQDFCRLTRKKVEVFFDNAPHGQAATRNYGVVRAHYIRRGTTADQAIQERLQKLKRNAHNWTVVSSDNAVRASARFAGARNLTSEEFSDQLLNASYDYPQSDDDAPGHIVDEEEISEWMTLFNNRDDSQDHEAGTG